MVGHLARRSRKTEANCEKNVIRRTGLTHMAHEEKSFAGASIPGLDTAMYRRVFCPYGLPRLRTGHRVSPSAQVSTGFSCFRTPFRKTTDATRDCRTSLEVHSVAARPPYLQVGNPIPLPASWHFVNLSGSGVSFVGMVGVLHLTHRVRVSHRDRDR